MHSVSIEKDTRFVIWFKEDDSGVLCPQIRVETLGHTEGLGAVMVFKKDFVIVAAPAARRNSAGATAQQQGNNNQSRARDNKSKYQPEVSKGHHKSGKMSLQGAVTARNNGTSGGRVTHEYE